MGVSIEELNRAGLVEKPGGKLEKVKHERAVDIRCTAAETGQADISAGDTGQAPVLERHLGDGALGEIPVQEATGRQFHVRVTTVRSRLLDDDNCAEKYHVDLLRYAGVIPGDSRKTTRIKVVQQKAQAGEREEVILEVFEI